jgi:hypothetical protein
MDIKNYLLVSLGEEAGEVQQAVGKAYRFGFLSKTPSVAMIRTIGIK